MALKLRKSVHVKRGGYKTRNGAEESIVITTADAAH